jgi:phosphoribosylformylglycinamidine synthase I
MVKKVTVAVLKSSGTNCDEETKVAFERAGGHGEIVLMNDLYRGKKSLKKFHILVFPGGFSYGDDIAAGKVWAAEIKHYLFDHIQEFINQGKLVLGICNGFQVLVKLGLLPALNGKAKQTVSLISNDSARYEDRWVHLKVCSTKSAFIKRTDHLLYMPTAHAEGKFVAKDDTILDSLFSYEQVVFTYCDDEGESRPYPVNPNGSVRDIAGICDSTGQVLGMMPHPERASQKTHYPDWRRNVITSHMMGFSIIHNGVDFIQRNLL